MFSNPLQIADAIDNPKFQAGDHVIFAQGPLKYTRAKFLRLSDDVQWGMVEESSGKLSSYPVEWMQSHVHETPGGMEHTQ